MAEEAFLPFCLPLFSFFFSSFFHPLSGGIPLHYICFTQLILALHLLSDQDICSGACPISRPFSLFGGSRQPRRRWCEVLSSLMRSGRLSGTFNVEVTARDELVPQVLRRPMMGSSSARPVGAWASSFPPRISGASLAWAFGPGTKWAGP